MIIHREEMFLILDISDAHSVHILLKVGMQPDSSTTESRNLNHLAAAGEARWRKNDIQIRTFTNWLNQQASYLIFFFFLRRNTEILFPKPMMDKTGLGKRLFWKHFFQF